MNTIGLQIKRASSGLETLLTVNNGEWTRKVVDVRDILKLYEITEEAKFVTFMSFSEEGTYITILSPISGRGGDNIAAWIFIPDNVEIDGMQVLHLTQEVKKELAQPKRDDKRLKMLFDKQYPITESAAYLPSAVDKNYAKRQEGFYQIKDILGSKRYQPYYSKYNAILIEDEDSMKIIDPKVVDISTIPLEETVVLCPPQAEDLKGGITVCFDDACKTPFANSIRRIKGERVPVIFERKGFCPIKHICQVEDNNQRCCLPPHMNWQVSIDITKFSISALIDGKNLTDIAKIYVNDQEILFNNPIKLDESQACNAHIKVSVSGYEDWDGTANFLQRTTINVQLHRTEREQQWQIELTDGSFAQMTLRSKHLSEKRNESPIKGYSAKDNNLKYTNYGVLKQRAIGVGIACAIFCIIWMCCGIYNWYNTHTFDWELGWPPLKVEKIYNQENCPQTAADSNGDIVNNQVSTVGNQSDSDSVSSLAKAIAYLDGNQKWERDDLMKYPELVGLFEEMNNYEFDQILLRKKSLTASRKFTGLVNAIDDNKSKNFSGTYIGGNDFGITVERYIEKLYKDEVKPAHRSNNNGVASDAAKNAQKNSKVSKRQESKAGKNKNEEKKGKRGETI